MAGIDNNTVTVYADDVEVAKKAKKLMDEMGALDIQKFYKEKIDSSHEILDEDHDRIIAKARHNVYFLDGNRYYKPNSRGMDKRMDSFGSKD